MLSIYGCTFWSANGRFGSIWAHRLAVAFRPRPAVQNRHPVRPMCDILGLAATMPGLRLRETLKLPW